jgi:hypothetical protein
LPQAASRASAATSIGMPRTSFVLFFTLSSWFSLTCRFR